MKRVVMPELLDTDAGTPAEVSASLEDLRWFNRNFGGATTTSYLLHQVAKRLRCSQLSFLDIAGASGDGALAAQKSLAQLGVRLQVTLLDRSTAHVPDNAARDEVAAVSGDALHLPFRDNSFDVVGSSLFMHHLDPEEIMQFTREALRVCRHAVTINDLRRAYLHWLTAWAGRPLYRSRLTRNDAPVSVRRAYTPRELLKILRQTGATNVDLSHHYFYRMGLIIWKEARTTCPTSTTLL